MTMEKTLQCVGELLGPASKWSGTAPFSCAFPLNRSHSCPHCCSLASIAACSCSLQGWQTTKGFTYLRRPVEARMRFTPALSKCAGLTRHL